MLKPLPSLVPKALDFLSLSVEDVAEVLMVHLNSYPDGGNEVAQMGKVHKQGFFNTIQRQKLYPDYNDQVERILLEGWSWLENEGFLAPEVNGLASFITRRGRAVTTREDFTAYRKSTLLPKHQVHYIIASNVYPAFQRGDYDVAVFLAFREVEIAVRNASGLAQDSVGEKLRRTAFAPGKGPLQIARFRAANKKPWLICSLGPSVFTETQLGTPMCPPNRSKQPKSSCSPASCFE